MIVSRSLSLNNLRYIAKKNFLLQSNVNCVRQAIIRQKFYYRKTPHLDEFKTTKTTLFIGAFAWWYVLWHLFTDYHMILGYTYPDPSKWTNEELGIPED